MNSNSAFFMFSSVAFLFVFKFPTMWLIWMYFASFPSVLYLLESTIGKLSPRRIMLSSSVSSSPLSISPSSDFSRFSDPPPSLFALLISSASISACSFRLLLFGRDGAKDVLWLWWSYLRLRVPGLDNEFLCSTSLLFSGLLFRRLIISIISRVAPQW